MPKVDMNCPRCGKESTEYAPRKWQCLHCGGKFIYDPDAPEREPKENPAWLCVPVLILMSLLLSFIVVITRLESREREYVAELKVRKLEAEARILEAKGALTNMTERTE